jgi:hypothetical protein
MKTLPMMCLLVVIASAVGCTDQHPTAPSGLLHGQVTHVVCMRLRDSSDANARREVLAAKETLETIPGVAYVTAGSTIKSDRPVVDRIYDVVFVFQFHTKADLDAYLANPTHVAMKKDLLDKYVEKYVVYDFASD